MRIPLTESRPDLASQWHPNNERKASEISAGSHLVAKWLCPMGHEYEMPVKSKTKGYGCPVCSGRRARSGYNDIATLYPELCSHWADPRNPSEFTKGSNHRASWKCPECSQQWVERITVARRRWEATGNICQQCQQPGSNFEKVVLAEVRRHGHVALSGQKPLRTSEGSARELDIYIPSLGLAFEVQDFATHDRHGDDTPTDLRFNDLSEDNSFKKGPTYHREKKELAALMGIRVVEIWEDEILDGRYREMVASAFDGRDIERPDGSPNLPLGSPKRAIPSIADNIDLITEWLVGDPGTIGTKETNTWQCPQGHRFKATANVFLARRDRCRECAGLTVTPDNSISSSPLVGEFSSRNYLSADEIRSNASIPVWWVCSRGHEFQSWPSTRNRGVGCGHCSGHLFDANIHSLSAMFPLLAEEWSPINLAGAHEVRSSNKRQHWWRCHQCRQDYKGSIHHRSRMGCRHCGAIPLGLMPAP